MLIWKKMSLKGKYKPQITFLPSIYIIQQIQNLIKQNSIKT